MFFRPALRVAINAQLRQDSGTGGIVTVLKTLAALPRLDGKSEEYAFVTPHSDPIWLRTLLPDNALIVSGPADHSSTTVPDSPFTPLSWFQQRRSTPAPERFFDSLDADVVHFPYQSYEPCRAPTIFNPHDLQHLHYPEFFKPEEIARREILYPFACRSAHTVVVGSHFVRNDIVERYALEPEKVQVIPWAPPPLTATTEVPKLAHLKARYNLPDQPFALYPAMTWEHKNHIRLLKAAARLRSSNKISLALVCTGQKTEFWPAIERCVNELDLGGLVAFTGLVPDEDLHGFYRSALFTVIPTLFEAASGPLFESWQHGTPAACSSVTSLPDQAADAALLFDPWSVEAIADALERMAGDSSLREQLVRLGSRRLQSFRLERTAKAYRAVYRRAAGRRLSAEDRKLLAWDWTKTAS